MVSYKDIPVKDLTITGIVDGKEVKFVAPFNFETAHDSSAHLLSISVDVNGNLSVHFEAKLISGSTGIRNINNQFYSTEYYGIIDNKKED